MVPEGWKGRQDRRQRSPGSTMAGSCNRHQDSGDAISTDGRFVRIFCREKKEVSNSITMGIDETGIFPKKWKNGSFLIWHLGNVMLY